MNFKEDLKKMPYYSFWKIEDTVSPEDVKNLRSKLNVSQVTLARIFGISEKTVEKWESGHNPIKGTAAKLIYILNQQPEIADLIYTFKLVDPNEKQVTSKKAKVNINQLQVNEDK